MQGGKPSCTALSDGIARFVMDILGNAPAPVYLKDCQGRYLYVNRRYEELARVTNDGIRGRSDHDIFPPEIADLFRVQDQDVIRCERTMEFEETVVLPDGEFTFITVKFPIHDSDGVIQAVGGFCTDITERKKVESEKAELIASLRKALDEVRTLRGIIPICASCKKVRDDKGYWKQVEQYVHENTGADFSHGYCPECVKKLPGYRGRGKK